MGYNVYGAVMLVYKVDDALIYVPRCLFDAI